MKIFVQIPAYRDPQLVPTIEDMLKNAANPKDLRIGICNQFSQEDQFNDLSRYKADRRFRIINMPHTEAKGVGFAMYTVQKLFKDEDYCLKIDSHSRFINNWDNEMIGMIELLRAQGYPKPLLTGYPPPFYPDKEPEGRLMEPCEMHFDKFINEGVIRFNSQPIPNWQTLHFPVKARFLSGGFYFAHGQFVKEVPYNPEYYFHGEEISLATRAFTNGYDLFHPHKVLLWHEYQREGKARQWEADTEWFGKDLNAHAINRRMFGIDMPKYTGKYGLGTRRTLHSYEKYAGVDFRNQMVQQYTLDKRYPPNPEKWDHMPLNNPNAGITQISSIQCDTNGECGCKCWYCPVKYEPRPAHQTMDPIFFNNILDQIEENIKMKLINPDFKLWLSSYNDLLLDPQLSTRLEALRKHSFKFNMVTNAIGLLNNIQLLDGYKDVITGYTINLPAGNAKDYTKYTGNSVKIFDAIKGGLQKLYEIDQQHYLSRVIITVNGLDDNNRDQSLIVIPEGEMARQVSQLQAMLPFKIIPTGQLCDRAGILKEYKVIDNSRLLPQGRKPKGCANMGNRLTTWLHISSCGNIYTCCQDFREKFTYANLKDQTLSEIISGKARETAAKKTLKDLCGFCIFATY